MVKEIRLTTLSCQLPDFVTLSYFPDTQNDSAPQARVGNFWSPMTYTVLPNESSETLRTAFKQVRAAVEANGGGFTRNCEVMFDFDKNLRQVYMEEIGNDYDHKLRGCSFHFGQCVCKFVNGEGWMPRYRDKTNTVLRAVIQACLGIPYIQEQDIDHVVADLHSIFDHTEETDPETYKFLTNFVNNYIQGYWFTNWERNEICFWGDESHFCSENMTNNAIESYNNEFYTLLGRKAHPNFYVFMSVVKKALQRTKTILTWVERGDYEEVKSRRAKSAVDKRYRLKMQYITRLKIAENDYQRRMARLNYMRGTGSTNTRILAKGRKKLARKKRTFEVTNVVDMEGAKLGRPGYKRMKAPEAKKCRFCGKMLKSQSGKTNHEKVCKNRTLTKNDLACRFCSKSYKVRYYLEEHEKKCGGGEVIDDEDSEDSEEEEGLSLSKLSSDEDVSFSEEEDKDENEEEEEDEDENQEEGMEESPDEQYDGSVVKKLKQLSNELLYCDNDKRMDVLVDQLKSVRCSVEEVKDSGAAFILKQMLKTTKGLIQLKIKNMYERFQEEVAKMGIEEDDFDEEAKTDKKKQTSRRHNRPGY